MLGSYEILPSGYDSNQRLTCSNFRTRWNLPYLHKSSYTFLVYLGISCYCIRPYTFFTLSPPLSVLNLYTSTMFHVNVLSFWDFFLLYKLKLGIKHNCDCIFRIFNIKERKTLSEISSALRVYLNTFSFRFPHSSNGPHSAPSKQ